MVQLAQSSFPGLYESPPLKHLFVTVSSSASLFPPPTHGTYEYFRGEGCVCYFWRELRRWQRGRLLFGWHLSSAGMQLHQQHPQVCRHDGWARWFQWRECWMSVADIACLIFKNKIVLIGIGTDWSLAKLIVVIGVCLLKLDFANFSFFNNNSFLNNN